jgi:WD40 repeat protein
MHGFSLRLLLTAALAVPAAAETVRLVPFDDGRAVVLDVGHRDAITALALSPDGTLFASASRDGTVRLFDAKSGKLKAELLVAGEVFSVAFSPDGARLATGSTYNLVKLWDVRTARALQTFEDNRMWVTSVAFSPDGHLLASCDGQAGVVVRDLIKGTVVAKIVLVGMSRLFWRPDGRALAIASPIGLEIVELDGRERSDAGPPRAPVFTRFDRSTALDISWDRAEVVFSSPDLQIRGLYDGARTRQVAHGPAPMALAYGPGGQRLAIGGQFGGIEIRGTAQNELIARFDTGQQAVTALAWSRDGERLLAGDAAGEIAVWSLGKSLRTFEIAAQTPSLSEVAWGPNGRLATQYALWDLGSGTILTAFSPPVWSVAWCGDVLVTIGRAGITWRNGGTGSVIAQEHSLTRAAVSCSPDGRQALAFGDGLELWDTAHHTGRKISGAWVGAVAWGPRDRVALGFQEDLEIWRLATGGEPVRELRQANQTRVLAWRRDGTLVAETRSPRRIDEDLVETGLVTQRLPKMIEGRWLSSCAPGTVDPCDYTAAAFSPDGTQFGSVVQNQLTVIDTRTNSAKRTEPRALLEHPGSRTFAWSPDGRRLAVPDMFGVTLIRLRDGAQIRLREVRSAGRLFGLVTDSHGHFSGDTEATARVVLDAPPASAGAGARREHPSRDPQLLAKFLAAGGQ